MKKIFRNIGIIALVCFSFLITDETVKVVKETDKLMIEIKELANLYYVKEINGVIKDKYITLGHNGLAINLDKSYQNMKRIGYFNENMLIYENIKPSVSILNNKDKIINGNSKNEIAIIFKNPSDLDEIIKIFNSNNLKTNIFIDNNYYKNNFETIELAIMDEHNVGIMDNYKELKKELNDYICYSSINCSDSSRYTIEETYKVGSLKELKKNLKKGTIIEITDASYLDIYLKYILSKGHKIVKLSEFINEELK